MQLVQQFSEKCFLEENPISETATTLSLGTPRYRGHAVAEDHPAKFTDLLSVSVEMGAGCTY